jgi:PAS domain S-box-containing protein
MIEYKSSLPSEKIPDEGSKELVILTNTINRMIDSIRNSRLKLKDNEAKLKDSEFRWKFAVEGSGDGLWDWKLKDNELYLSPTWKKMIGYEEDELQSKLGTWEQRIHPEDIHTVFRDIRDYLNGKKEYYKNEHRVLCKDGTYKWILARGFIVQRDEKGKAKRLIGTHTDITEQKNVEEKLQEQKEEFETIFRNSSDGIAIFDFDMNFLNCNEAYAKITGYSKEELLSKSCIELTPSEDVPKSREFIQKVKKEGFVDNFEKRCIRKDGNHVTVNMGISLMHDKERLLVSTRDITKLKLVESQAKLASMGEMIGNIAHQWRQPLSVITTSASAMDLKADFDDLSKDEIKDFTNNILKQSNYLSKTIDDFKNFIKEDKQKKQIDTMELIDKTLSIVNPSIVSNNIKLIVKNIKQNTTIQGYENELIQALINILNNAKDAVNANIIESDEDKLIFIDTLVEDNRFTLKIRDNGGGISENVLDRIFEPYFTTKHQNIGTGIGLSMTYKIIAEHHKGNIIASNEEYEYEGKLYTGASFRITLNI